MNKKCGHIALVGAANAGKSTLLNRILGANLAPVTHKRQTTRVQLRGILSQADTQYIFLDTPGIFKAVKEHAIPEALVAQNTSGYSYGGSNSIQSPYSLNSFNVEQQAEIIADIYSGKRNPCSGFEAKDLKRTLL